MQQFLVLDDKNAGVANLVNFDQFQRTRDCSSNSAFSANSMPHRQGLGAGRNRIAVLLAEISYRSLTASLGNLPTVSVVASLANGFLWAPSICQVELWR